MSCLIVFHLPATITEEDLRESFSQKGNVISVQIIFTVNKEDCYFAIIVYQTAEQAETALNYFDKLSLFSSRISVERCEIINELKQKSLCKLEPDNITVFQTNHATNYEEVTIRNKRNRTKKKNLVKLDTNDIIKVDNTIEAVDPVIETDTLENKEKENDNYNPRTEEEECIIHKPEEILQQPQKTQDNSIQNKLVEVVATPKLPNYIEKLPYAEGQWSYVNQTGKKVYSKSFLSQLENEAVCQKKPIFKVAYDSLGRTIPNLHFIHFKLGNSQCDGKNANKTAKPYTIHKSRLLKEEVKLNQTNNVLVPTVAEKATKIDVAKNKNEDELKTEDAKLYSEVASRINVACKNIILEYECLHNLDDIIYSLTTDKNSVLFLRHKEFVKSMIYITLDSKSNSCVITGSIFAELLSKKVLSPAVITKGIDAVLVNWNSCLILYPEFFSYIAAIITPFRYKLF